jgi:hypothetical protein
MALRFESGGECLPGAARSTIDRERVERCGSLKTE